MRSKARMYLAPDSVRPGGSVHIPCMGIHELMPAGFIRHGGRGTQWPYLLMLFHDPACVIDEKGTPYPAHQKMIVWDLDAAHHYGHAQQQWDHTWLQVEGDWARQAIGNGDVPLNRLLDLPHEELVLRYLQMLHDELQSRRLQDPDMIEGILRLLWHELVRSVVSGEVVTSHDPRMEKARRYLEVHCGEPFELARVADEACLSPSHFCFRFSREYGVSPHEYAMRLRLHRAAHLLANPQLAVFQVAEMVGYEDALYFSRVFRKRYGTSPREYRRRLQSAETSAGRRR